MREGRGWKLVGSTMRRVRRAITSSRNFASIITNIPDVSPSFAATAPHLYLSVH